MQFEEVLKNRHSVRKYQNKAIPKEEVKKIIELANLSPSCRNLQARSIVVVESKKAKEALFNAVRQESVKNASVDLVICANVKDSIARSGQRGQEFYSTTDAVILASYIQLIAVERGFVTCWVGGFDQEKVDEVVKTPEGIRPIYIITLGYSAEEPRLTDRKNTDQIILKEM